jgi:RimJ/RimL family protein N-acetyltransferase
MDPAISKQMYAIPLERNAAVDYLSSAKTAYTVFNDGQRIGGFTVSAVTDRIGTFGFFLSKPYRGQGFGKEILRFAENEAAKQGFLTMRADVYADNNRSIETLKNRGFRLFVWMEKNLRDSATGASESISGPANRVS